MRSSTPRSRARWRSARSPPPQQSLQRPASEADDAASTSRGGPTGGSAPRIGRHDRAGEPSRHPARRLGPRGGRLRSDLTGPANAGRGHGRRTVGGSPRLPGAMGVGRGGPSPLRSVARKVFPRADRGCPDQTVHTTARAPAPAADPRTARTHGPGHDQGGFARRAERPPRQLGLADALRSRRPATPQRPPTVGEVPRPRSGPWGSPPRRACPQGDDHSPRDRLAPATQAISGAAAKSTA